MLLASKEDEKMEVDMRSVQIVKKRDEISHSGKNEFLFDNKFPMVMV